MTDTLRFQLPLIAAAQAQKHVTANEALSRLDALAAGRLEDIGVTIPPTDPAEGAAWGVGAGASDAWTGQDGRIAIFLNGGWVFVDPFAGQRAWNGATAAPLVYAGTGWVAGLVAGAPGGAVTVMRVAELDHTLATGPSSTTADIIPDKAVVIGVTGRVTETIGGATAWDLGVAGAPNRYGTGYGVTAGSFVHGVTGQPQAYFGATPLVLTAQGSDFSAGRVTLAVHYLALTPPLAP